MTPLTAAPRGIFVPRGSHSGPGQRPTIETPRHWECRRLRERDYGEIKGPLPWRDMKLWHARGSRNSISAPRHHEPCHADRHHSDHVNQLLAGTWTRWTGCNHALERRRPARLWLRACSRRCSQDCRRSCLPAPPKKIEAQPHLRAS